MTIYMYVYMCGYVCLCASVLVRLCEVKLLNDSRICITNGK